MPSDDPKPDGTNIQPDTAGEPLFRLVAEALLRAGVKSIPLLGSGLDQATFGIKDAIASATLRKSLRAIVSELGQLRESLAKRSEADIASLVESLLGRPSVQQLVQDLGRLRSDSLAGLADFLQRLARESGQLEDVGSELRSASTALECVAARLVELVGSHAREAIAQYDNVGARLARIEKLLIGPVLPSGRPLEDVVAALEHLGLQWLCRSACAVRRGCELVGYGPPCATVDFCEVYRYAMSPFLRDPISSFTVYDFQTSASPLYLLPASASELSAFLHYTYLHLADPASLRARLREKLAMLSGQQAPDLHARELAFLADATLSYRSPLQRLRSLFKQRRIAIWQRPLPSGKELQGLLNTVRGVLGAIRGPGISWRANEVDAWNLATVCMLRLSGAHDMSSITHLSGCRALLGAALKMQRRARVGRDSEAFPLVLDPCDLAFAHYLRSSHGRLGSDLNRIGFAARVTEGLPEDVRSWAETIRAYDAARIASMAPAIRVAREGLQTLRTAIVPFQEILLQEEIRDVEAKVPCGGATSWESKFEEAHSRVIATIADLLSYLEPVEESIRPFRELRSIGQRSPDSLDGAPKPDEQ